MTKVLHLSTERAWRGGENQLLMFLKESHREGLEHHVVLQPGGDLAARFNPWAKVHAVRMRNDADFFAAIKLASIVKRENIDIIHAHTGRGHSLGLLAKKILKLSRHKPHLIVHRRVEQKSRLSGVERWKYLNPDVDLFICVSDAVGRGMEQAGIASRKIRVVHSAIDSTPFKGVRRPNLTLRREFGIDEHSFVACFVGAVEDAKGIFYLLEAWKSIVDRNALSPDAKLLVVGHGDRLEEVTQTYKHPSLLFTGFRRDISQLLTASDVIVLPTLWEGLGTVLLEGLLAGCAPIASNVGGVPEIVIHNKTGLLVSAKDSEAIGVAIKSLHDDRDLRVRLVAAGQKHVESQFSVTRMTSSIIDAYRFVNPRSTKNPGR